MVRTTAAQALIWFVAMQSGVAAVLAAADLRLIEAVRQRDAVRTRALLAERVDPNTRQPDGATALHWAVQWDDESTVALLIRAGADVNVVNDYGVPPLAVACENATPVSVRIVEALVKAGANPNATLPSGQTMIMTASLTGSVGAVRALVANGANVNARETAKGQTALMWAASEGHRDVVRMLLDSGADPSAHSMSQSTPLFFAARVGGVETARLLLAAGADVNARAADGSTALLTAAFRGHIELAKVLLEAGADPNVAVNDSGYTALHWAAGKSESHETVPYARSEGEWAAQVGIPAEKGQLDFMKALLVRGANPNTRATRAAEGRRDSAGFDPFSERGATPFWLAARAGDAAAMRLLVEHGADPLLPASDGTTPLIAAAGGASLFGKILGSSTLVLEASRVEASKLALALGADVNQANAQGNTALHAAAFASLPTVATFLISQGARVNLRNHLGDTALKVAEGFQAAMTVANSPEVSGIIRRAGGTARAGPPGMYDRTSAESNLSLWKALEERAVLVNQLETLESSRGTAEAGAGDAMAALRGALAAKDDEIKKIADASFYFYDEKPGGAANGKDAPRGR
jgi:ankyrin repeat protein